MFVVAPKSTRGFSTIVVIEMPQSGAGAARGRNRVAGLGKALG